MRKLITVLVLLLTACSTSQHDRARTYLRPSEINVSPSSFDGKRVTIRGFLTMRFEDRNLWDSEESHKNWDSKQCISIVNYYWLGTKEKELDGKFVEIVGVYMKDADEDGKVIRMASCNQHGIVLTPELPPQIVEQ